MSIELMVKAMRIPFNSAAKVTLIAMADQVSDQSPFFWGSQEYLGRKTGISDRQVRTHLSNLEKAGFIRREKRFDPETGQQTTDAIYIIEYALDDAIQDADGGRKKTSTHPEGGGSVASKGAEENGQGGRKSSSDKTLSKPYETLGGTSSSLAENGSSEVPDDVKPNTYISTASDFYWAAVEAKVMAANEGGYALEVSMWKHGGIHHGLPVALGPKAWEKLTGKTYNEEDWR